MFTGLIRNMSVQESNITDIEAAIKFQRLTQTGSMEDYASEFLKLSSRITQETYVASLFFVGLKPEIQDQLYQLEGFPSTYEAMSSEAIRIYNQLHEQRKLNNLCFNCGKPGHVARKCSKKW